ncbi:cytochrome b [Synechocystis sp. LEGE 06083]|uniref:cytochrome b n=1 Tax=Synechocystis sp. LEGE 06083 TaxID=915336 RepID=UPI00187E1876|nr:cytochrome b/b6 domain-containing protein [Synechocystis sp. LEGE 06083]MBE9195637.1 cytochrome b [Synechocystis sp. LEGE 06083]
MSPLSWLSFFQTPGRLTSAYQHLMALHWSMSWCYFCLFPTGLIMADLSREVPIRSDLYDFHKGLGVFVIGLLLWRILVLLRVWWKKYSRRTPRFSTAWWRKVTLHSLLYLFMLAVPLSGLFFSNSFKSSNVFFLGMTVPDLFSENEARVDLGRSLHFWLSYLFLTVIVLHVFQQRKVVRAIWRRWTEFLTHIRA